MPSADMGYFWPQLAWLACPLPVDVPSWRTDIRRGPLLPRSEVLDAGALGANGTRYYLNTLMCLCGDDVTYVLKAVPPEEERDLPEK